jgi:hypothetical protein
VLFCGHTHVPYVRTLDAVSLQVRVKGHGKAEEEKNFTAPLKQIINVGSVGEPSKHFSN